MSRSWGDDIFGGMAKPTDYSNYKIGKLIKVDTIKKWVKSLKICRSYSMDSEAKDCLQKTIMQIYARADALGDKSDIAKEIKDICKAQAKLFDIRYR